MTQQTTARRVVVGSVGAPAAGAPVAAGGGAGGSLLSVRDLGKAGLLDALRLAQQWRSAPEAYRAALAGRSAAMLFEKPSLRTRVSFEVGLARLGMHAVYLDHGRSRLGEREAVKDYALNLERWVDLIVARVFEHGTLVEMAAHARVPIVNALSDLEHPCQAVADVLTLAEKLGRADFDLSGVRVAWLGDGNNVCHSLMLACASLGASVTAITPKGFEPRFDVVRAAVALAESSGATIELTRDTAAVEGHHAVYTDAWVSMGQDHQAGLRGEAFAGWQVDAETMELAGRGLPAPALFMHCLPAHRGEEVTDEVIDSKHSVVYDQAENRLHAQNALVLRMLGAA